MASPFSIVTALVDQIDFTGEILSDTDIRISGKIKLLWILKVFVIIILQPFLALLGMEIFSLLCEGLGFGA